MAEKRPVAVVSDVFSVKKYDTPAPRLLVFWAWAQLYFQLFLLFYFFAFISKIGSPDIFLLGGMVVLGIWAMTEQMDGHRFAPFWELLKCAVAVVFLMKSGSLDWFGANERVGFWYTLVVVFWQILTAATAVYFWKRPIN